MKTQKWKKISKKEIEEGYKEVLGEKYSKLTKREQEDLYKRYRMIESTTKEYYTEKQREKKDDRNI